MTARLPEKHCCRCNGTDDLILGDSPLPVCRGCVELLGGIADDPAQGSERLLATLMELHADVVRLARTASEPHELVWEWVA